MKKTRTLLAGAVLALGIGPAMGALQSYEDNDLDFHYRVDGSGNLQPVVAYDFTNNAIVDTELLDGDLLIAVLEFESSSIDGLITADRELTGISVIEAVGDNAGGGFQPYTGGYNAAVNAILGPNTIDVTGGGAGGAAMVAMWLDDDPNLDIEFDLITTAAGFSCDDAAQCLTQASDGILYQVDGIELSTDYWTAIAFLPPSQILQLGPTASGANIYAGLSVIDPGISGASNDPVLDRDNGIPGVPPGPDVAVAIGGTVNGGGFGQFLNTTQRQSLVESGYVATSDFQLQKDIAVPNPATLALLGVGLLGLRLTARRRA